MPAPNVQRDLIRLRLIQREQRPDPLSQVKLGVGPDLTELHDLKFDNAGAVDPLPVCFFRPTISKI